MKMLTKTLLAATALTVLTGGAMAADLSIPGPAPVVSAPAPGNWDGPYVGANIGYGWGFADHQPAGPGPFPAGGNDINPSGFLIGGQIGYNFHLSDNIVAGIEGNLDWSNESGSLSPTAFGTITQRINWDGAIVAKLGYDAGAFLPYVDAGVAFANATRSDTVGDSVSATHTGWTVGVGVEYMLADNLSAFVSYNYADYGAQNYGTPKVELTDSIVKVGLNWHF